MQQNNKVNKEKKISKWLADAKFRRDNKKWLDYSGEIALRILALIDSDKELNQKKIADSLKVSPQYINKIIQGRENLTLETIGKLSDALQFELISFPPYKYQQKDAYKLDMVTTGIVVPMPIRDYHRVPTTTVATTSTESTKPVVNY